MSPQLVRYSKAQDGSIHDVMFGPPHGNELVGIVSAALSVGAPINECNGTCGLLDSIPGSWDAADYTCNQNRRHLVAMG